ncbi:hypothetical protein PAPHI01_1602 [Pancytospora philotis]|nr:hypothetical protein PAPHI01_1602 [Pancytospora philotis]
MELYEVANRITRMLECALVGAIAGLYLVLFAVSAWCDRSILASYLIATAFIHYLLIICAGPTPLIDDKNAAVRGICAVCNKVRGSRTKHCRVCNRCHSQRDHHCMLIGRCVTGYNLRSFYSCLLFTTAFLLYWTVTKQCRGLLGLFALASLCASGWYSLCISSGKTSSELLSSERIAAHQINLYVLAKFFGADATAMFLPALRIGRG